MRSIKVLSLCLFILTSGSCLSFNEVRIDPAPLPVVNNKIHTVAVYANAICDGADYMPNVGTARGNGFFVSDDIVVTVAHLFDKDVSVTYTKLAVFDSQNNCFNGRIVAIHRIPIDILFVRIDGHHGQGFPLSSDRPNENDAGFICSFAPSGMSWQEPRDSDNPFSLIGSRVIKTVFDHERTQHRFGAQPPPRQGDSGSPMINIRGEVIGMAQGMIVEPKTNKDKYGVYISGHYIKKLFDACRNCKSK